MTESLRKLPRELIVVTRNGALAGAPAFMAHAEVVTSIAGLVRQYGGELRPHFGLSARRLHAVSAASPSVDRQTPLTLARYYRVDAPEDELVPIAASLQAHPEVQSVFVKPAGEAARMNSMLPSAAEPPSVTADFTIRQNYLDAAPGGVDARYAWTVLGGSGDGVSIIDIEGEWRFSHEDLVDNEGGVVGGTPPGDQGWRNHGTAVLGVFHGDRNDFGITGICPNANVRGISVFPDGGAAAAIRAAADMLNPGDIILIELHYPGPRFGFQTRDDQRGYIPAEWWPDTFEAVQYATQKGVIVVEAGGNGAENLDDPLYDANPPAPYGPFPPTWSNPFQRSPADSGAIIVGAGAPPQGSHQHDWGPDRSRLDFSNYGSMVDVQGWGREVTSTGYGDLQGGDNEDLWYTDQFSGTSSASPVIVGVIGAIQGVLRAAGQPLLTPGSARALLRSGGSPQQEGLAGPVSQRIGNRPDLRAFIQELIPTAPQAVNQPAAAPVQTININIGDTKVARIVNINL